MQIVGICFKENGKVYYFDSNNIKLNIGDSVIVETERGLQYATIVICKDIDQSTMMYSLKKVVRKATKDDYIVYQKNMKESLKALETAKKLSLKYNLKMIFTEAFFTFDRNQLLFYFISDNRVDFRELAKELAKIYKTRIELRQIGVRDKAKEISGIGMCGCELCCSRFLNDLDSVTINMAKNQNLSLNPSKINGVCGRLLCCLKYEDELYKENRKDMPNVGDLVATQKGDGIVTSIDIPRRKFIVNVPEDGKIEVSLLSECDNCGKCSK